MTSNFFLNNLFTYRDRRLRGLALLRGLFTFYAICALGTVANVGIAGYILSRKRGLVARRRCRRRRRIGLELRRLVGIHVEAKITSQ